MYQILEKIYINMNSKHSVLLVATSAGKMGEMNTGVWLEELAAPYYKFIEQGFDVSVASPKGGAIPIDSGSMQPQFFTEAAKRFMLDPEAVNLLSHSIPVTDINGAKFSSVFLCGGHGTCIDFIDNPNLNRVLNECYNSGKVLAAVCHGPNALASLKTSDGTPLIKDKNVTGFSSDEEEMVGLTGKVPFVIETEFMRLGGKYSKGQAWTSHAVADGTLITGQNPQSSEAAADLVIQKLIR